MSLVLVADDEPAVLEVLSQVVEDLGHDVLRAKDGEEAFELARARRPHLVVTDYLMPKLSGLELCRRMRRDEILREVPVILLSGVLQQRVPEVSAFLYKPFEINDFETLVHEKLLPPRG
jgi:CheY-like chemotaxis protein